MPSDWQLIGHIGVDAGVVMVGDPCYTQGRDASSAVDSWDTWLAETMPEDFGPNPEPREKREHRNWWPVLGQEITGMVVSSGYGDGRYPVYVKLASDRETSGWGERVAELKVVFIGEDAPYGGFEDD